MSDCDSCGLDILTECRCSEIETQKIVDELGVEMGIMKEKIIKLEDDLRDIQTFIKLLIIYFKND